MDVVSRSRDTFPDFSALPDDRAIAPGDGDITLGTLPPTLVAGLRCWT